MHALTTVENPSARLLPGVLALIRDVEAADGHEVLEAHRWIDLANADAESLHGIAVTLDDDTVVGYVHLRRHHRHGIELELLVAPDHRDEAASIVGALVEAASASLETLGPHEIFAWVPRHSRQVIDALEGLGFRADRAVRQLRRPLPLESDHPARPADCPPLRTFRPGKDEDAWLEVNNRAFAWHPDQGDWDLETLLARERESWFDPAGFLLAEQDGRLVGFCWTKVHAPRSSSALGEIYVIATDPERAPRGLGSCLLVAGLDYLAHHDIPTASLYVEDTNERALRLYDRFGFVVDHEDVRLVWRLPAAS